MFATSSNDAKALLEGDSGGAISVTFFFPTATVAGKTKASFGGVMPDLATDASLLTVRSKTANAAKADANITQISLIGAIGGASATAEITGAADNEASVGSSASIRTSGAVTIEAIQSAANFADADVRGGSAGSWTRACSSPTPRSPAPCWRSSTAA